MEINLPPELQAFVDAKVANGDYSDAEELVKDSIRFLEKLDALAKRREDDLKRSLAEAANQFERGEGTPFTEDVVSDIKRRGRERLAQQNHPSRKTA